MSQTKQKSLTSTIESKLSPSDTISITSSGTSYSSDYGAIPPITSTPYYTYSSTPTVTIGTGIGATGTTSNAIWTTNSIGTGLNGVNWSDLSVAGAVKPSATITLKGENADIDLNGKSMKAWMEKVEERLNIMTPNLELEKEWDELRELGERYRELEKKCKEKADVWNKLKKL